MPGDIKDKYVASTTMTTTALQSLASSSDWLTGWGSAVISNTTNCYSDYMLGATFTTSSASRQAGVINVYVVAALNDTPLFPAVSSGTLGTEGAISFVDSEERDAACRLICSITIDNTNASIVAVPQTAIAQFFGGSMPSHFCFFVSQNSATTTAAGLAASGSAVYYTPKLTQYT